MLQMGLAPGRQIYKLQQISVNESDSQSHQQKCMQKKRFNLSFQGGQRKKRKGPLQTGEGNKTSYLVLRPLSRRRRYRSAHHSGDDGKEELQLADFWSWSLSLDMEG